MLIPLALACLSCVQLLGAAPAWWCVRPLPRPAGQDLQLRQDDLPQVSRTCLTVIYLPEGDSVRFQSHVGTGEDLYYVNQVSCCMSCQRYHLLRVEIRLCHVFDVLSGTVCVVSVSQVLRPPAPPSKELPQEEVRPHQPPPHQEEAQVNAARSCHVLRFTLDGLGLPAGDESRRGRCSVVG